jgi:hypothetical protein
MYYQKQNKSIVRENAVIEKCKEIALCLVIGVGMAVLLFLELSK